MNQKEAEQTAWEVQKAIEHLGHLYVAIVIKENRDRVVVIKMGFKP